MKNFVLSLTLLFVITLTAFGQRATDSINFSIQETRSLLRAWENEPRYIQAIDTLKKIITLDSVQINNLGIIVSDCIELNKAKSETISAQEKLSNEYKDQATTERRRKKFWRLFAGIETIGGAAIIGYEVVKNGRN